jgi:hypothetical protein
VEEKLRQERATRQEAEGQLQQERAALVDARSALEREHAALERARTSLEEREAEVSKLDGELIALSISNADQVRTLEEQSATVISLQQVSRGRGSMSKVSCRFVSCFVDLPFGGPFPS